jgi:hypothetical protein
MDLTPYVGITDFTDHEQVATMLEVLKRCRHPQSSRKLHVGVMMSYKTLHGMETKWSKAFPPKERIPSIFSINDNDAYYCLHYADYEGKTRYSDLVEALQCAGYLHAIQLDMPWPDPGTIIEALRKSRMPSVELILQIGERALDEAQNCPREVVRRLDEYREFTNRVLLDKSMGRGIGMDAEALLPFAHAITENLPNLGLVVAGGLGPESIDLVRPLAEAFPEISIDAQGKLRPSGDALDPIDWNMAGTYLAKALEILR